MPGQASFQHTVEQHLDALAPLLNRLIERTAESLELGDALGRVAAVDVRSTVPLPLFRNSQMDGFAVRSADVTNAPVVLPVVGELAAARAEAQPLRPGTAIRIMTGAPMPDGADAVIPVEATRAAAGPRAGVADDTATDAVELLESTAPGRFIREPGSDLPAGSVLVSAGDRLTPRRLAALAAAGLTRVDTRTRVRVAVISTGSELIAPGEEPGPGELFDSNGIALAAAATEAGASVVHRARVRDDDAALLGELDAACSAGAELIVTSGGVSMGEHEVVRETLEPLGVLVGKVSMQPGGPQGYGAYRGIPVLCFPGNPVSSQLSFELFAAPVLRAAAGMPAARRTRERLAVAIEAFDPRRRQFQRGRRSADGRVEPVGGSGSHLVTALAAAELLIVVPERSTDEGENGGPGGVLENDEVEVLWLS